MFMKSKPDYTQEELLKKVSKKYYSVINIFMKHNADRLSEHQEKDYIIWLEEGKSPPFIRNYRLLLDQKNNAIIK